MFFSIKPIKIIEFVIKITKSQTKYLLVINFESRFLLKKKGKDFDTKNSITIKYKI